MKKHTNVSTVVLALLLAATACTKQNVDFASAPTGIDNEKTTMAETNVTSINDPFGENNGYGYNTSLWTEDLNVYSTLGVNACNLFQYTNSTPGKLMANVDYVNNAAINVGDLEAHKGRAEIRRALENGFNGGNRHIVIEGTYEFKTGTWYGYTNNGGVFMQTIISQIPKASGGTTWCPTMLVTVADATVTGHVDQGINLYLDYYDLDAQKQLTGSSYLHSRKIKTLYTGNPMGKAFYIKLNIYESTNPANSKIYATLQSADKTITYVNNENLDLQGLATLPSFNYNGTPNLFFKTGMYPGYANQDCHGSAIISNLNLVDNSL